MNHALKLFWQSSSILAKVVVGVVLLILLALAFQGGSSCRSHLADKRADKKQAELQAEADAAKARADEWEAKAREYAAQAKLAEVAVQAAGAKAEAIAEKIKVEDAKLVEELKQVDNPVADPCERVARVCERLRIKPADCSCTNN